MKMIKKSKKELFIQKMGAFHASDLWPKLQPGYTSRDIQDSLVKSAKAKAVRDDLKAMFKSVIGEVDDK